MNKYKITENIYGLSYFKPLFNISSQIELIGELEIDPFQKFSPEYGCTYWYFKYSLLQYDKIVIEKDEINSEYEVFFTQTELYIMWISIVDESNYKIKCVDGIWYAEIYNEHTNKMIRDSSYQWISLPS